MFKKLKYAWWEWNPVRLRRLLALSKTQIEANQNGWANTHLELVKLKEQVARCYNCSAWKD